MRLLWLTALVVVIDQATKLIVLKTMYLGQQIPLLGNWLKFTYTENPGMAFGITFGPKALVTVFSVIATILIAMYFFKVRHGHMLYRTSLALILGGAVGNIIDRVFYGVLFGNDTFFVGRVVDFIHVNVWSGFVPESLPFIGGTYVSLFPIWNVADMAIVCGVVGILIFQKAHHQKMSESQERAVEEENEPVGAISATLGASQTIADNGLAGPRSEIATASSEEATEIRDSRAGTT